VTGMQPRAAMATSHHEPLPWAFLISASSSTRAPAITAIQTNGPPTISARMVATAATIFAAITMPCQTAETISPTLCQNESGGMPASVAASILCDAVFSASW